MALEAGELNTAAQLAWENGGDIMFKDRGLGVGGWGRGVWLERIPDAASLFDHSNQTTYPSFPHSIHSQNNYA